jgi:hypothetical protein
VREDPKPIDSSTDKKEKKKDNLMSFLQANEKPEDKIKPTPMPSSPGIKHDEFKDYNGVRRAPQEDKKEEVGAPL